MFAQNVGNVDRIVRVVLGLALIAIGFFVLGSTVGTIAGVIGFIFLLTGLVGWCPLYLLFKFSTRPGSAK
jgi:Inner membrane protein YgaP-like, transmembrane domain